ncbi:MAG: MFS transporter [Candidatus Komeilibacteria bacterium]
MLIFSDFLIWSSYQFLAPIFALFITDRINQSSIETVGLASAIYLISKSIFEIPVGAYIDRSKSEKDDLYTAISGTILASAVFFAFIFIGSVWELYILQIFMGLANALAFPGWYSIFTKHIDKEKAAFEWSLYDVLLGIGMAATAAIGGILAEQFGFNLVFIIIGTATFLGALSLLSIKNKIYTK